MPRRQRFKPSRKPKPAIDTSDSEIIQPTTGKVGERDNPDLNAGQHRDAEDAAEDRVPR